MMSQARWRWALVLPVLAVVGLVVAGCNGGGDDDDDEAPPPAPTNAPPPAPTNAPDPEPTPVTMKAGQAAIGAGALFQTDAGATPEAGDVVAMATWSEGGQLTMYMKGGTPANLGWVKGQDPLTCTGTGVAKNTPVSVFIYNETPNDVTVDYTVVYNPP